MNRGMVLRSVAGWVSEQMGGVAYLDYIRNLANRLDSDWEGVQGDLEKIRFEQQNMCGTHRFFFYQYARKTHYPLDKEKILSFYWQMKDAKPHLSS